ncbi:FAST kinase domain-containing protein 4-like [Anneissia japonica]|uniref:FAST kinase domain-containing protein 4-like n=1 Tax=Anneissia japonica TaxID=1529436 RepID=UPI001425725B|nr:FAST kinase domain-containing protein 4-like [Anneissia japonica]
MAATCRIVSLRYSSVSKSRLFVSQMTNHYIKNSSLKQHYKFMSNDNLLDTKITSSDTAESLLHIVQENKLSGNQASLSLTKMTQLLNVTRVDHFTRDQSFQKLCTQIAREKYNISTESLVLSLINVCRIQTEPFSPLILILEPECRRRLRAMQIRHLIFLIANHSVLLAIKSDSVNKLVKEAAAVLEFRLKDVFEVKNLTQLLMHSSAVSQSLPKQLQNHMISLMDYFSFTDLTQFCKSMLAGHFPTGILLRTMSIKMAASTEEWTVEKILDVLKCFSGMGFNNRNLMIAFSSFLQTEIKNRSLTDVLDIAQVYSSLRVASTELFAEVEKYVGKKIESVTFRDLRSILHAFFVLRYVASDEFAEAVTNQLLSEWLNLKPYLQLELTWCMMGLDILPLFLLEKVLRLNTDDFNPVLATKHQHLINYAGTETSTTDLSHLKSAVNKDVKLRPLQESVKIVLENVVGEKNLSTNVLTPIGHSIEFQLLLDSQRRPIDVQSDEHKVHTRLAILVHGPTSYLYASERFVGPVVLRRKQLKAAGYKLTEVGYREWNAMQSEDEKKQFIRKKLENVSKYQISIQT